MRNLIGRWKVRRRDARNLATMNKARQEAEDSLPEFHAAQLAEAKVVGSLAREFRDSLEEIVKVLSAEGLSDYGVGIVLNNLTYDLAATAYRVLVRDARQS